MLQIILVFVGGGLGSVARLFTNRLVQSLLPTNAWPLGTLLANLAASFILGVFVGYAMGRQLVQTETLRALIAVGFCGGFSTFSSFSLDTLQLFQTNRSAEALLNIFVNVAACLAITLAGIWLGRQCA